MDKNLQEELLENLSQATGAIEAMNKRFDAEKAAREELSTKFDDALEGWKKLTNDREAWAAAEKAKREELRKVEPETAKAVRRRMSARLGISYRKRTLTDEQTDACTDWMCGFLTNDKARMGKAIAEGGLTVSKTDLAEGTSGSGAELVPEEYAGEILKIVEEQAAYRPRARVVPMTTDVRNEPKRDAAPTVTWKGEAAAGGTGGEPTYGQMVLTANKLLSIYTASSEVIEDANVGVLDDVNDQLGEAVAKEEDRVFFEGDISGLSDPFDGLRFETGLEELSTDEAAGTLSNVRTVISKLETRELRGAWWYMSPIDLLWFLSLEDTAGRLVWSPGSSIAGGPPATIYGYPYATTDVILRNRGVGTDESSMYFGNLAHSTIGDRTGMTLAMSEHTKFADDQIDIRLRKRTAYGIQFVSALVRWIDFDTVLNPV